MENNLQNLLTGNITIVGMGNPLREDDGAGPALIRQLKILKCDTRENLCLIDAGEAPENYIGKIIKQIPDTILFADATDLKSPPGSFRILRAQQIANAGLSTHNASLKMTVDLLEQETGANIFLLGIQADRLRLGKPVSEPVKKTINHIAEIIKKGLSHA